MNLQNLGFQESVGFKYIDGSKFGLKATGIFVILLSRDGFKCDPETKFQTITSKSQFRSSRTEMFFKTGVLQNATQVFSP